MKLVNKKDIPSLDYYIEFYKINNYCSNFDSAMAKLNKITNKRLRIGLIPFEVLFAIWLITGCNFHILLILGTTFFGGTAIFFTIKDGIAEEKAFSNMDTKGISATVDLYNTTNSLDRAKTLEDYYTDEFKEFIKQYMDGNVSEEEEKYNRIVEEQIQNSLDGNEILDLNESASEIAHHIDFYYKTYKLPKLSISNDEWDFLFNYSYDVFKEKGITSVYFQSMSTYVRTILAKVLVSEEDSLTIEDFTNNLDNLSIIISGITPVTLDDNEIKNLKNRILKSCKETHKVVGSRKRKIVNIFDYQKKRTLK